MYINRRNQQKNIANSPQIQQKKPILNPTNTIKPVINPSKFVFVKDGDIWVNDNSNQKKITDSKFNIFPTLSPDLSKVAYLSELDNILGSKGGRGPLRNVWLINIDGTNPQKITNDPGHFTELKFSPNGKYLSYIDIAVNKLSVIDLNTGNAILKQAIGGIWIEYGWSSNSDRIILASQVEINNPTDFIKINILEIDLVSRNLSKIASLTLLGHIYMGFRFSLPPDLKYLVYFIQKQNINTTEYKTSTYDWGYWLTNLDGTNPKEILGKKINQNLMGLTLILNGLLIVTI